MSRPGCRFRRRCAFVAVAVFLIGAPLFGQEKAGPRYALVIGNSDYSSPFPFLKNPVNDARDLAAALRKLGFHVTDLYDQDQKQIQRAVIDFRDSLSKDQSSEGFFYFAGHGVQANRINYLIPLRAQVNSVADLEIEAVNLQQGVLDQIQEAQNRVNIIVLDACRNNPLPSGMRGTERGLAVVNSQPPDSTILFSTVDNAAALDGDGKNSPFAEALLDHIDDSTDIALTIKSIAVEVSEKTGGKQTPTAYGIIGQRYSLNPQGSSSPAPALPPVLTVVKEYGSLTVDVRSAGILSINQTSIGQFTPGTSAHLDNVQVGLVSVEMRYDDGKTENQSVEVRKDEVTDVSFTYAPPPKAESIVPLSVEVRPGVDIPLGTSGSLFGLGGSLLLTLQYQSPSLPWFLSGAFGYDYDTVAEGSPLTVSVGSAWIGTGVRFGLAPFLTVEAGLSGGYFFGFFNDFSSSSGNPFVSADAELIILPGPWHVTVGTSYRYYFGLYGGIVASAGASYDIVPLGSE